jgi:hypothetical protein
MKCRLIRSTLFTLVMFASSGAYAGLIVGNYEYMELEGTLFKTNGDIEAIIGSDPNLDGYTLATDMEVAFLWDSLRPPGHTDNGWHAIDPLNHTSQQSEIADYFRGMDFLNIQGTLSAQHGSFITYDKNRRGYLRYKNSVTGVNETGFLDLLELNDEIVGYLQTNGWLDIGDTTQAFLPFADSRIANMGSVYTRTIDVTEPSTLAIFALGMIGLVSRRIKKQS